MDKSAAFDLFANAVADAVAERLQPGRGDIKRTHAKIRRGVRGPKLTAEQVTEIRHLKTQGFTDGEIANQFNVTAPMVNHIVHRRSWRDVP